MSTSGNEQEIRGIVTDADDFRKGEFKKQGTLVSANTAIGHVFCSEGRNDIRKIVAELNKSQTALAIDYYLTEADKRHMLNPLTRAWAGILVGSIAISLDYALWYGWSVGDFGSDYNFRITGTPLPKINSQNIISQYDQLFPDKPYNTNLINRKILDQMRSHKFRIGCFFIPENMLLIPVIPPILICAIPDNVQSENHYYKALIRDLTLQGTLFDSCAARLEAIPKPNAA